MSDFDLQAAQAELAELKVRGRALERLITAALQAQLRELGTLLYHTSDTERLLDEARALADERG